MAKISLLPTLANPTGSELVPVVSGGATYRAPLSPLVDAAMAPGLAQLDAVAERLNADAPAFRPDGSAIFCGEGVDEGGFAAFGVDATGDFHATLSDATRGYIELIHPDILVGVVDDDGYVYPISALSDTPALDFSVFASGGDVFVIDAGARPARVTLDAAAKVNPSVAGESVRYIEQTQTGFAQRERAAVIASPALAAAGLTALVHLIGFGQSNSLGWIGGDGLDGGVLDPGRAFMFPGSITPGAAGDPYAVTSDTALGPVIALAGPDREGRSAPGPRVAHAVLAGKPATTGVLWSGHGVAGQSYSALRVGNPTWANMRAAMLRAALQAWTAGIAYEIGGMLFVQGENDTADGYAEYLADLNELVTQFTADARAIAAPGASSSTLTPPIFVAQPASWTKYGSQTAKSDVPRAEMAAMAANASLFVFMPMYFLTYADGIHPVPAAARLLDEYAGRAWTRLLGGGDPRGLFATGAARNGANVTVTCHVPAGALAIDTAAVSDPGQLGLTYHRADGSAVAIGNIAVSGAQITFTLASAVAGTLSFAREGTVGANAGPTTGPRCCIRGTSPDVSSAGTPMHDWMLIHDLAVA